MNNCFWMIVTGDTLKGADEENCKNVSFTVKLSGKKTVAGQVSGKSFDTEGATLISGNSQVKKQRNDIKVFPLFF